MEQQDSTTKATLQIPNKMTEWYWRKYDDKWKCEKTHKWVLFYKPQIFFKNLTQAKPCKEDSFL